jgi:hypothetical protein
LPRIATIEEECGLQVIEKMVARDGIEPPTPAFSGLDSLKRICMIRQGFLSVLVTKWVIILEWFWNENWNELVHQSIHHPPLRFRNVLLINVEGR